MEPAKLNSSDPADAKLEALLREHGSDALPDDGFSQRVMALLPAARLSQRAALVPPRFSSWSRADLSLIGATVAAALVLFQVTDGSSIDTVFHQAFVAFSDMTEAILDPHLLWVVAIMGGVLLLMADERDESADLEHPEWRKERKGRQGLSS